MCSMSLPSIPPIFTSPYQLEYGIAAKRLAPLAAAFTVAKIASLTKQPYIRLIAGIAAPSIIFFTKSRFQEHYRDFSSLPLLGKSLTLLPAIAIGFITPAVFNSFFKIVSPLGHVNFLISTLALNMFFVPFAKKDMDLIIPIDNLMQNLLNPQPQKQKRVNQNLRIQELAELLETARDELDRKDIRIASLEQTEQKYLQLMRQIEDRRAQREREAAAKKE